MISKSFYYVGVFAFQLVLCSGARPQPFNGGILSGLPKSAAVTSPGRKELQIRVVDRSNLGTRVLVNLDFDGSPVFSAYSDWSGNVAFEGLAADKYTVVIMLNEREVYRKTITLPTDQNVKSEVLRLSALSFTYTTNTISVNDLRAPAKAYKLYLEGIEAIRSGNVKRALETLDGALEIYPAYSKGHNARGVVLHMTQRNDQAEEEFRASLRFDAESFEPRFNLGKLLLECNRPVEARDELQRAFELNSESAATVELLVDSMLTMHDTKSAIALTEFVHRKGLKYPARIDLEIASELRQQGMALRNSIP